MDGQREAPSFVGANGPSYGLRVHQASGMIAAQADCTPTEALNLLVAYAAFYKRDVDETASEVIDRRVRFDGT